MSSTKIPMPPPIHLYQQIRSLSSQSRWKMPWDTRWQSMTFQLETNKYCKQAVKSIFFNSCMALIPILCVLPDNYLCCFFDIHTIVIQSSHVDTLCPLLFFLPLVIVCTCLGVQGRNQSSPPCGFQTEPWEICFSSAPHPQKVHKLPTDLQGHRLGLFWLPIRQMDLALPGSQEEWTFHGHQGSGKVSFSTSAVLVNASNSYEHTQYSSRLGDLDDEKETKNDFLMELPKENWCPRDLTSHCGQVLYSGQFHVFGSIQYLFLCNDSIMSFWSSSHEQTSNKQTQSSAIERWVSLEFYVDEWFPSSSL